MKIFTVWKDGSYLGLCLDQRHVEKMIEAKTGVKTDAGSISRVLNDAHGQKTTAGCKIFGHEIDAKEPFTAEIMEKAKVRGFIMSNVSGLTDSEVVEAILLGKSLTFPEDAALIVNSIFDAREGEYTQLHTLGLPKEKSNLPF